MANIPTFGATILSTPAHANSQLHRFDDSPNVTPTVSLHGSTADLHNGQIPAQSPFYQHPPTSREVMGPSKSGKLDVGVYEKDIESGNATPLSASDDENPFTKVHRVQTNSEDTMWPSKLTLKHKREAEKQQKRGTRGCVGWCAPLRTRWTQLSKRNRLLVQFAIAILVIGIAVAIGVGISAAVKGTYFVADGSSKTVGQ